MIKETTYNIKEIKNEIRELVGRPMSLLKRIRIGGNGSQRLVILEASKDIEELINFDNRSKFCNIELRDKGMIMHFRSRLETYAWIVPFHLLSLFKTDNSFAIYAGSEFVRLAPAHNSAINSKFFNKMLELKAELTQNTSIP